MTGHGAGENCGEVQAPWLSVERAGLTQVALARLEQMSPWRYPGVWEGNPRGWDTMVAKNADYATEHAHWGVSHGNPDGVQHPQRYQCGPNAWNSDSAVEPRCRSQEEARPGQIRYTGPGKQGNTGQHSTPLAVPGTATAVQTPAGELGSMSASGG